MPLPPLRIAVAARKGGVGKTTVATGIAAILAESGKRTLLVDLDPQSNAAFALGVDPAANGTAELLSGQTVVPAYAGPNLWVLPGGPSLAGHAIAALDAEDLLDALAHVDMDAVVLDCPPGTEHLERLGLAAATIGLVVLDAHPFAVSGAARVLEVLEHRRSKDRSGPRVWALVQSRLDSRRALDRELENSLNEAFPQVPVHKVRQDTALALATTERIPMTRSAAGSRGFADLQAIVEWIHVQE